MNEIKQLDYKMEWVDHLHELYGSFILRNDPEQWFYFLRRPEMSDKKKYFEIRLRVMKYVMGYGHISQRIIKILEEAFKYSEDEKFFIDNLSLSYYDYYRQVLLDKQEFPPYEMFGELDEDRPYDEFISIWDEIYDMDSETPDNYLAKINELKALGIEHPYIPVLDCLYYNKSGEYGKALACLTGLKDCYDKHIIAGFTLMNMDYFVEAEVQFLAASEYEDGYYSRELIEGLFLSKYHCGRIREALEYADNLAKQGYEPFTAPLQLAALKEITDRLIGNYKLNELEESDCIYICRYLLLNREYENVIELCRSVKDRKFKDGIWTIGLAQAYLYTGEMNKAAKIVKFCYDGKIILTRKDFDEIRHLRAQILFGQGHIEKAYEIIETLCSKNPSNIYYQMTFANMCMITGRNDDAIRIYTPLRFNVPENPAFSFKLARCNMKKGEYAIAHEFLELAIKYDPEYSTLPYYLIQCSAFGISAESAQEEFNKYSEVLDDAQRLFISGIIQECNGDLKGARATYKKIMDSVKESEYGDNELLYDAYERYFIMREELNGGLGAVVKEISNALEAVPNCAQLWCKLGNLYIDTDYHPERAKECFEKAFKADSFCNEALAGLIDQCIEEDKWREALAYCDIIITNTQLAGYYLLRANCNMELGMDDDFAVNMNEFVKRGGNRAESYDMCAWFAMKQGDYKKAEEIYEKILENCKPNEVPCYENLATCLCKQGKEDEAISLLEGAIMTMGTNPDWLASLYKIQLYSGKFDEARKTLSEIGDYADASILNDDMNYLSAQLAFEAGNRLKATAIADTLISDEGERFCAILNILEGSYRAAEHLLKKRIKKNPDEVENYIWMAICQALRGKGSGAAEWAQKGLAIFMAIHVSPENLLWPEHMYRYGILAFLSGDKEGAYEMLDKAAKAVPCYAEICGRCHKAYFALGLCKGLEGKKEESKAAFDEALAIKPNDMLTKSIQKNLTKPAILCAIGSIFS